MVLTAGTSIIVAELIDKDTLLLIDAIMVFVGAVTALVAATAIETTIGNKLSRVLSAGRIGMFSTLVVLAIGRALSN